MPNFWRTCAPLKLQWFPLGILIFGQKSCFLVFKIPQPNWYYYTYIHIINILPAICKEGCRTRTFFWRGGWTGSCIVFRVGVCVEDMLRVLWWRGLVWGVTPNPDTRTLDCSLGEMDRCWLSSEFCLTNVEPRMGIPKKKIKY